ncbi:MAG: hypothetical protein AAGD11_09660 [Planctomycetota bacterium]
MKTSLNLVSERSRKRNEVRRCLRVWSRVLAVVALIATIIGIGQWYVCSQKQSKQASAEAEYEPVRQLKIENVRLRKEISNLQRAEIIPLKLAKHQPLLGLVGLTTKAVNSQQQRVFLKRLEIDREPMQLDPSAQATLTVGLRGIANDASAAQQLADYLRKLGPFESVDLTTRDLPSVGQQQQFAFSIQCVN